MKQIRSYRLIALGLILSANGLAFQDQKQNRARVYDDDPIELRTTLVQVPVVVSEPGGRYVTNLHAGDFTIFEDGVRQKIALFGSVEEPFNVALLLDSSGSTSSQLSLIKSAALAFIDNLRPQDKVMVVSFNDSVQVHCELTGNRDVLSRAVSSIPSGEFTQVYEAVYTAVWERLHDLAGRKAVILFTDGIDTASSEIALEETLDAVIESEDIIVYPIRYGTRGDVERKIEARLRTSNSGGQDAEVELAHQRRELDRAYRFADEYLEQLAEMSGGVVERADELGDLQTALGKIARELRQQYLIGYYPSNRNKDQAARKIRVEVARPDVTVRARPEYRMTK